MQSGQKISSEWQNVLDNYLNLDESWKKEIFLKSMSSKQKDYLLQIVQDAIDSKMAENLVPTKNIYSHTSPSFQQNVSNINLHPNGSNSLQYLASNKDEHLLSHKDYKTSKRKWWATLLPVFLIATVISGLSGLVFFAWIGGGIPKLSFLNNIPGNKAKADEITYVQWIEQFDTIKDTRETLDFDADGISNFEEFQLGLNPVKFDENNNSTVDGLDYINKDISLLKNVGEQSKMWQLVESQSIFLRLQKATLLKLGLQNSGESLLKLTKIVIPKLDNLEVLALPENTDLQDSSSTLKKQAALVHYLGTNWAGENLSVWFSNQGKIEQMMPGDKMEAYLQDDQENSWYQIYQLQAANSFSADSQDIFKNESNIPNLKIVLCQPENGCNKALVLTFEIKETKQITFDNQISSLEF